MQFNQGNRNDEPKVKSKAHNIDVTNWNLLEDAIEMTPFH